MRNAVLTVLFLALSLVLFEFAGRVIYADRVELLRFPDHRMDPTEPDNNSDGIRSRIEPGDVRQEDVNIIFLGDSFTYGHRLPAEHALPQQLERMARTRISDRIINVFNFGWTSSSPILSLRLLRDIGIKYKPDTVILLVDISSDFHDDLVYTQYLHSRRGIYRLIDFAPFIHYFILKSTRRLLPEFSEWLFSTPSDRFFAVNRPLAGTRPNLEPTIKYIDEIAAYSEDVLHARFLVAAFPRGFMYSDRETPNNWEANAYSVLGPYVLEPFRFFEEVMAVKDHPYLSLLPAFQNTDVFPTTFDDDPHWTIAGTEVAAQAMFEFCLDRGCFSPGF